VGSHIDEEDGLELIFERRLDRWPDEWASATLTLDENESPDPAAL
jgi:hypothetical protein